ncbi:UNVERIFIED_CONTAM: hypothetical protein PYX00_004850 [Menopon gallinae]|uniref:Uncharacterized protein n=1 Tax=Menopon gallinae TaxID=328185 RepID=A0AAW2I6A7_9NEOP
MKRFAFRYETSLLRPRYVENNLCKLYKSLLKSYRSSFSYFLFVVAFHGNKAFDTLYTVDFNREADLQISSFSKPRQIKEPLDLKGSFFLSDEASFLSKHMQPSILTYPDLHPMLTAATENYEI